MRRQSADRRRQGDRRHRVELRLPLLGRVVELTSARLTKCALRHASMPTTLGGSFLKLSTSASRLTLRRKAILPSELKPTMWKTSLPMSMPIEVKAGLVVSVGCCGVSLQTIHAGEAAGPSHSDVLGHSGVFFSLRQP